VDQIGVLVAKSLEVKLLLVAILDLIKSLSTLIRQMQPLDFVITAFKLVIHGLHFLHQSLPLDFESIDLILELVSTLISLS
jgi:hypothetical protein